MKITQQFWLTIVALATAFLVGWNISTSTGVEPGYFDAPEAAGYGAGVDKKITEGIDKEMQEYYDQLKN